LLNYQITVAIALCIAFKNPYHCLDMSGNAGKRQLQIPDVLRQNHFPSLDGLRGVSILLVIVCHVAFEQPLAKYFDGQIGVEIFFVISGFLITTLLLKEKATTGTVSFKKFYVRRFLRIMPVVVLFLAVLLALNFIFQLHISYLSFLSALLYFRNLPFKSIGEWHAGHFWSLSVEEQFYLLFPWLLIRNVPKAASGMVIFIITVPLLCYLGYNRVGPFQTNHLLHIATFIIINLFGKGTVSILIGALFSVLMFYGQFSYAPRNRYLSLLLFILALAIRITVSPLYVPYVSEVIFACLMAYIIILNLHADNLLAKMLNLRLLTWIGLLSYSLYIWQQLFTHQQPWAGYFPYADSPWLNIPALFLVAYLSYNFYEKRFLKLKNKFKVK
jgi:peptidoglycan/LPS O-acetylase OafA/YrhL